MTESDQRTPADEWSETVRECFEAADNETRAELVEAAEDLGHDRAARVFQNVTDWNRYVSSWYGAGVRDNL